MILLFSLATWRTSSLISKEEGPFRIFERFRHVVGVRYDEHSERYGTNEFARLLLCNWCSSVWIAALWAIFAYMSGIFPLSHLIPSIFAYSAGSILIDEVIEWLEHRR